MPNINIDHYRKNSFETTKRKNSGSYKPVKEEILYLSKSIQLSEFTFENENGKAKSAEVIRKRYMVGVNNNSNSDVIQSIAVLKRHILCDCLILVRQYRPSLKSYALEFPASVIEQRYSDKTGDFAVKEIEENTGYGSAKIKYVSPETAADPELCDSKIKLVSMIIDGDDPIRNNFFQYKKNLIKINNNNNNENNGNGNNGNGNGNNNNNNDKSNQQQQQQQEENDDDDEDDDIEIVLLPINGLLDRLCEFCENGTIVDSRVYAFAIGLKKGERLNQNTQKPENIEVAV